jgi:hypothetical protein
MLLHFLFAVNMSLKYMGARAGRVPRSRQGDPVPPHWRSKLSTNGPPSFLNRHVLELKRNCSRAEVDV